MSLVRIVDLGASKPLLSFLKGAERVLLLGRETTSSRMRALPEARLSMLHWMFRRSRPVLHDTANEVAVKFKIVAPWGELMKSIGHQACLVRS